MQPVAPHSLSGKMTEEKAKRAIYKLPDTDRAAACQRHGQEAWDAMTWTQRLEASGGGGDHCQPQRPPRLFSKGSSARAPLLKTVQIVRSDKGTVGLRIFRNKDFPSGPWHILQVAPNSPAGNAGCKVGDAILAVDGKSVVNLGLHETNGLFAGFPDSIVSVLLKDDASMRLRMPAESFDGLVETFAKVKDDHLRRTSMDVIGNHERQRTGQKQIALHPQPPPRALQSARPAAVLIWAEKMQKRTSTSTGRTSDGVGGWTFLTEPNFEECETDRPMNSCMPASRREKRIQIVRGGHPPSGSIVLSKAEEAEAMQMLERAESTRQERTHLSVEASVGWVFSNSSASPRLERRSSPANPASGNPPPAQDLPPGDAVLRMLPSAPGRPYLADYPSHQNGNTSMYHAASSQSLDKDTMACSDKTTPKVSCDSASYISAHSEATKPLLRKSPAKKTDSAQRRWVWLPCCLAPKQHKSPVSLYMSTDGSVWTCWPCCRLDEQKRMY
jgi:hypothetical protein